MRPATTVPATDSIPEIEDLLMGVYCACEEDLRVHVASLACQLFRRVDIGGEDLAAVARSLDLETGDAEAILAIVRRDLANAIVGRLSTVADPSKRRRKRH